jgi:hypothetical protein
MLTSWHEGSNPTSINENISILLVQFVKELVILSPQSDFFERASESICDNSQVIKSLTKRMMLAESSSIKHEFPLLQKELSLRTQKYLKFLISFKIDFSSNYILSPSDFGIHNLLLSNQGRHIFYDFEFFGFDRPEKLLIDTLIHPRNYWEIESITSFTSYFIENDLYSEEICQTFAPYSVLNWMYILLKRFSNQSMGLLDRSENTPEGRTEPRDVLLEIELLLDLFDNLIANKGDNLATLVAFALDKSQWRRGEIK